MPRKLEFKKTNQEAVCKVVYYTYRVVSFWEKEELKYYQVQIDRKKILNTKNINIALRRMMAEANYELQSMFMLEKVIK